MHTRKKDMSTAVRIHSDLKLRSCSSNRKKLKDYFLKVFQSKDRKVHTSYLPDEESLAESRKLMGPIETPTGVIHHRSNYQAGSKERVGICKNGLSLIEENSFDEESHHKVTEDFRDPILEETTDNFTHFCDCFRFP
jgi:hypothetical protein